MKPSGESVRPVSILSCTTACFSAQRANKKERRTRHAPRTPTTGASEQYLAGAPCGALRPSTASLARARGLKVVVFWEAVLDAYASIKLSQSWPTSGRFISSSSLQWSSRTVGWPRLHGLGPSFSVASKNGVASIREKIIWQSRSPVDRCRKSVTGKVFRIAASQWEILGPPEQQGTGYSIISGWSQMPGSFLVLMGVGFTVAIACPGPHHNSRQFTAYAHTRGSDAKRFS